MRHKTLSMTMALLGAAFSALPATAQLPQDDSLRIISIQEFQVVSTRVSQKTPMAYSQLNRETIRQNNQGRDLPFLLASTPSVTLTTDAGNGVGYTSFRVRGTDPSRINITANGIPLNDGESSLVYFTNMGDFASSVQSIQIQRGVGTSTNGAGAFGATVNMLTEPITAHLSLDFSAGSYGTHKETLRFGTGLINGHFGLQGRLSNIGSDGYIDRASSTLNSYFLQASWFGRNNSIKLITFNGTERTYMAWNYTSKYEQSLYGRSYNSCGLYHDAAGNMCFYENQYDNYRQQHYQLHWNQYLGDWNTHMALHYTLDGYDYDQMKTGKKLREWLLTDDAAMRGDLVQRKAGAKDFYGLVASANYDNHDNLTVNLGGGANHFHATRYGQVLWVGTPYYKEAPTVALPLPGLMPNHPYYNNVADKTDINVYAKANWEFLPGLSAFGDVQYRYVRHQMSGPTGDWGDGGQIRIDLDKQFNFVNPKFGLNYQLDEAQRLYASYAVAHREPTRDHYEEHYGEQVRPERMGDLELGYKYQHPRWMAGINLYHMHYKDQFVLTGELDEEGVAVTKNIDKSYRMGIELEAAWQILDCLRWDGNATLSRNRAQDMKVTLDDYTTVVNIGETPLSFSPEVIVNNQLTYTQKAFRCTLMGQYVGEQYLTNYGVKTMTCWSDWSQTDDVKTTETLMLKAHFVANMDLSYTLNLSRIGLKQAVVGVTLYNLLNAKYDNNGWAAPQFRQDAQGRVYAVNTWGLRDSEAVGFAPSAPFNFLTHFSLNF